MQEGDAGELMSIARGTSACVFFSFSSIQNVLTNTLHHMSRFSDCFDPTFINGGCGQKINVHNTPGIWKLMLATEIMGIA
jgi:hypothetical protein